MSFQQPLNNSGLMPLLVTSMPLLSVGAAIAIFKNKVRWLVVCALLSIFPYGLYLLGASNFFALVGVFNIGYLLVAIVMNQLNYRAKQAIEATDP